jgi:uncharacterized membrane protein YdfJ with MMPL/SSD domain
MNRHISPANLGRWSIRHPRRAIGLWLGFVVIAVATGTVTGSKSLENGAVGESARGYSLLDRHQAWPAQHEYGYLHSDSLRVADPAFRAVAADVAARMKLILGGPSTLSTSADRHSLLVTGVVMRPFSPTMLRQSVRSAGAGHPRISVGETGDVSASQARDHAVSGDLSRAELLSVPVTLLVLLLAFGAGVAALVPVLLGLTAVIAAFGLLGPISQSFPLDDSVKTVVLLIGLAVGVDYALFYVIRSREERAHGLPSHAALDLTARTSGRTVLISGATVTIAMAGMYLIGAVLFNGIASGTIAVIACAVAGSVTVLPAVLGLLGPRIDRGRIPFLPHLSTDEAHSRFWPAVIDRVLRHPVRSCLLSAGVLVALAIPALGLHVEKPSNETLVSQSEPALATLSHVRADFPGTAAPAILVVTGPRQRQAAVRQATTRLEALTLARGIAHPPFGLDGSPDGRAAALELPLTGGGDNAASRSAISVLRRDLVPEAFGRLPGVETAVTGTVAEDVDFTHQITRGTPLVIGFVLVLAFVLLLVAFRSIVVPLKAITLNLLSVAAAYGVLVLVFQHHWAGGLLGFHSDGAIISWLPLFLFVVLFGLSMDYHVFIISRIREAVDGGMRTDDAVRHGITRTAGVVTSAAMVMVAVFSLFASLSSLDLKEAGIGLAAAVLIDATIVRAALLPASMKLLGDWNWYLPRWLAWLPHTSLEGAPGRTGHAAVPAPARSPS